MNHDRRDEELDAAYRRASAADAGQPDAKTRAAILAEAAAAARRRTPAANAPRYWMRAVAGVAVVGVALLVWRQVDYRLPGTDAAEVAVQGMREDSARAQPDLSAAAEVAQADSAASDTMQPRPQAGPAAPPSIDSREAAPATALAQSFIEAEPSPGVVQTAPRQSAAEQQLKAMQEPSDIVELVRVHFPAQYASNAAHRLWLVLDAEGEVLQQGELAPGENLEDLALQLAAARGERAPASWQRHRMVNAAGQSLELAVARLP